MFQMINTNDTTKSFFELFDNERYYYIQLVSLEIIYDGRKYYAINVF